MLQCCYMVPPVYAPAYSCKSAPSYAGRYISVRVVALSCVLATLPAWAGGDASEGEKLVSEKHCEACHGNKTYGDAPAVYLRKDRKVTSLEKLRAQVALCNSELGLQLFPDEEEHVVAYLDARYYHFTRK